MPARSTVGHLVAAAHPGPTAVVTSLAAVLGASARLPARRLLTLTGAVLSGQLTIGWSNDLIDHGRDTLSGRRDKPLATGVLSPRVVRFAIGVAASTCVVLSSLCGRRAGALHGVLVGSGWAYNLGLKQTPASFVPYAVAFGALPQVPTLCDVPPRTAPATRSVAGALLGISAHLLNVLPDLADDRRTGVHGLPHRLSDRQIRSAAAACLAAAGAAAQREVALGRSGRAALGAITGGLGSVVAVGRGTAPFYAAAAAALVDALTLIAAARSGAAGSGATRSNRRPGNRERRGPSTR
ncbi:UbiA family prenyltransferase [Blastococcus sp. Marseille-P5729]|uniref:UbiA family prenyltransferase n=1 Tax=Blastococcus sp. Marseille-P5729 TaxID=2086582 RepID=UPI000D10731C|nr:UbiA family prenyltransferase [Blastococcus sp. Marseille-P5729]